MQSQYGREPRYSDFPQPRDNLILLPVIGRTERRTAPGKNPYQQYLNRPGAVATTPSEQVFQGRLTGPIKVFLSLREAWRLDNQDLCLLLGYEQSELRLVMEIFGGSRTLASRDAKERIAHLVSIRAMLQSLFRDTDAENKWLRMPQDLLGKCAPLEKMVNGSMVDLVNVRSLVEEMGGR